MKNPVAVEVNEIEWKKGGDRILVTEAKMHMETRTGHDCFYYRYYWESGNIGRFSSVLKQWFSDLERKPVPETKWHTIALVHGSFPEEISEQLEPDFPGN